MADVRFPGTGLATATTVAGTDVLMLGQGGTPKELPVSVLQASGLVVVAHGATASTARPSGAAAVYWVGSVEPSNAQDHDLWYDTDA